MARSVQPVPEGHHTVTPYLVVSDADAVLTFIEKAFGRETLGRHRGPRSACSRSSSWRKLMTGRAMSSTRSQSSVLLHSSLRRTK